MVLQRPTTGNGYVPDYDEDVPDIEEVGKLASKDLRDAARSLSHNEARYMVDLYYECQDVRKSSQNRQRAAIEDREPNALMKWSSKAQLNIETVIQSAMDEYTKRQPLAAWARSIPGIGPVLAAGLMAHLGNQDPPPTVGHWWSFAGINPDTEWRGREDMGAIINTAYAVDGTDATAICTIAKVVKRYPEKIYSAGGMEILTRDESYVRLEEMGVNSGIVHQSFGERPHELGAAIALTAERARIPIGEVYAYLYQDTKLDKEQMLKHLIKRPWNARLKVLVCYKIGESFVKVQGREKDIYGKVFKERKELEHERNARGEYASQAEEILRSRRFRRDTVARAKYQDGKLPDAHIHARARRKAVRLFLSHFHEVAYFLHYNMMPPNPYALEYQGHVHRIFAPNAHLIPGLEEAQEVTRRNLGK